MPNRYVNYNMSAIVNSFILPCIKDMSENLFNTLRRAWMDAEYTSPKLAMAYEPLAHAWYFVVDDSMPIIELADERGKNYIVPKHRCAEVAGFYVCQDVKASTEFPTSVRQYFVRDTLVPILEDNYDVL